MRSRKNWKLFAIVFLWTAIAVMRTSAQSANFEKDDQYTERVETTGGAIRGLQTSTTITYLGIPYADPPVGEQRWRPPQPHRVWQSVLDATRFGHHCFQATAKSKQRNASEDCLFLNIYVPRRHPTDGQILTALPVMVWFHGGANAQGASEDFDPTPLVEIRHEVVVVTLNYRLGPFGFLAHPALDAEGHPAVNYGVMDQQLALKWVRANIAQFGGDARNVTIFGESAGGLDVATHLASPLSAGLFDKAIVESGAYELDTPNLKESEKLGLAFANRAGCGNQTTGCLRALSAEAVLAHSGEVNTLSAGYNQSTVDGQILHESLRGAFEHGRINRVPVLQGNNSDEVYLPPLNPDEYRKQMRSFANAFKKDPHQAFAIYSLKRFTTPALAVGAAVGDAAFECSAQASNRSLSKWVPTYAYEFSDTSAGRYGSMHGAEQRYLFRINTDFEDVKIDPKDARQQADIAVARALGGGPDALSAQSQRLSEAMRLAWTAFARNGNPDTPLISKWPLASDGVEMLDPSLSGALPNSELRTRHHCDFWNSSSIRQ